MFRRPPSSSRTYTRMPYATLFRAAGDDCGRGIGIELRARAGAAVLDRRDWPAPAADADDCCGADGDCGVVRRWLGHGREHDHDHRHDRQGRSEEHTSELQSLMRISSAVFCLKNKKINLRRDTSTPS